MPLVCFSTAVGERGERGWGGKGKEGELGGGGGEWEGEGVKTATMALQDAKLLPPTIRHLPHISTLAKAIGLLGLVAHPLSAALSSKVLSCAAAFSAGIVLTALDERFSAMPVLVYGPPLREA